MMWTNLIISLTKFIASYAHIFLLFLEIFLNKSKWFKGENSAQQADNINKLTFFIQLRVTLWS